MTSAEEQNSSTITPAVYIAIPLEGTPRVLVTENAVDRIFDQIERMPAVREMFVRALALAPHGVERIPSEAFKLSPRL